MVDDGVSEAHHDGGWRVDDRGPVRWVILDRPHKRNAMTRAMGAELGVLLEAAAGDDDVVVVVLTGTDGSFSAGLDRDDLAQGTKGQSEFPVTALIDFPKPTIAAVNGLAFGGGATMAMACDLRVAARSATITFGLTKVGLTPEFGSSYLLWRQIGYARALEVMLTARRIGADEAHSLGLVNAVVDDADLAATVQSWAEQMANLPAGTAAATKEVLRRALDAPDLAAAREIETRMLGRRGKALAQLRRARQAGG
jgi:enoyl-CoA hydratase/carnithine racemase